MQSVTVTIGRNVPTPRHFTQDLNDLTYTVVGPALQETLVLTDSSWAGFAELVTDALTNYAQDIEADSYWVETHDGLGVWDGVQEQSRKLTLLFEPSEILEARAQSAKLDLLITLTASRSGYYQDAVGVSFGDSTLV
jgi:hypothetical protein